LCIRIDFSFGGVGKYLVEKFLDVLLFFFHFLSHEMHILSE